MVKGIFWRSVRENLLDKISVCGKVAFLTGSLLLIAVAEARGQLDNPKER